MGAESAERAQLLKRIEDLEFKVRYRDEQLQSEREVTAKAKRKVKQLLLKLAERDEALAELRAALDAVRGLAAAASAPRAAAPATPAAAAAPKKPAAAKCARQSERGCTVEVQPTSPKGALGEAPDSPTTTRPRISQEAAQVGACQDEALRAFLEAAGSAAEAILGRRALRAAFEERPPRLAADGLEGCSREERVQVLSLFAAWVAVSGEAMHLEDFPLEYNEAVELTSTLESCGAALEDWEMIRCPTANESAARTLFQALATQPLKRLSLGYNQLGPSGASLLVAAAGGCWASSLQRVSLEMNGLGDAGCKEVAAALAGGVLPALQCLELGWNELTPACAPALAALLQAAAVGKGGGSAASRAPQLRRVGLGGNKLGCEGASCLCLAALAHPSSGLELDLSMNHVGVQPLLQIADWAEGCPEGTAVAVSINLEWNNIEDCRAVQRLAQAVGGRRLRPASAGRPLVRLGNNELTDLEPTKVSAESLALIAC